MGKKQESDPTGLLQKWGSQTLVRMVSLGACDLRLDPSVIFQISGLSWLDAIFVTFVFQLHCWSLQFTCFFFGFFYMHRCKKKKKRKKSAQHVITHAGVAAWGAKSTVGVLIRRLIRQSLLLDETLWRLHDRLNNLITGNRIMMGFLRCRKRAQCLLFPCKLRCPTSPLKITLKWFRWIFSNDPLPHVPLRLKIPSCETRVCCRREVLLCSWTPDTPTTRMWIGVNLFDSSARPTSSKAHSAPGASQEPRSCPGHTEMWDVSSGKTSVPDGARGPSDEGSTR